MQPVFRFAPSPNGRLHLGHAYSALLNQSLARRRSGRLLLRIEDIDLGRARQHFVDGILEDLAWLGLHWEEPVRRQAEHFDLYRRYAESLRDAGLLYPCFCTRAELARSGWDGPRDPDGTPLYRGACSALPPGESADRIARGEGHVWRLATNEALATLASYPTYRAFDPDATEREIVCDPLRWGDVVLVRRDVPTSYHLAVVIDDALQGVTHVVRGRDLEAATDIHVLLQRLLGLPSPRYHHHAVLTEPDGAKLAKSRGSESLADLRARGASVATIKSSLGF